MDVLLWILVFATVGGFFLCFYRAVAGPSIADRMVAIDILGILVASICALLALLFGEEYLIDIALAWILLAFIGTLTLAKALSGRQLDD